MLSGEKRMPSWFPFKLTHFFKNFMRRLCLCHIHLHEIEMISLFFGHMTKNSIRDWLNKRNILSISLIFFLWCCLIKIISLQNHFNLCTLLIRFEIFRWNWNVIIPPIKFERTIFLLYRKQIQSTDFPKENQ